MNEVQNRLIVSNIAAMMVNLLEARIAEIRDVAELEQNEGQVSVSASIKLDFSGKAPAGSVKISFAKKTTDEGVFRVEQEAERLEAE